MSPPCSFDNCFLLYKWYCELYLYIFPNFTGCLPAFRGLKCSCGRFYMQGPWNVFSESPRAKCRDVALLCCTVCLLVTEHDSFWSIHFYSPYLFLFFFPFIFAHMLHPVILPGNSQPIKTFPWFLEFLSFLYMFNDIPFWQKKNPVPCLVWKQIYDIFDDFYGSLMFHTWNYLKCAFLMLLSKRPLRTSLYPNQCSDVPTTLPCRHCVTALPVLLI